MPFTAAAAIGVAQLGGGIAGAISASSDRAAAAKAAQDAVNEIKAVGAPPDLAQAIYLKHFQSAGLLTPEVESAIKQGDSSLSGYQDNASAKQAQMSALNMLQQQGRTGLTATDRAAFNDMRSQMAQDSEGKRQQILQSFKARGMGGSGSELAAQLQAQAQAQNNASRQGDQIAATASQRALEAMTNAGQLGGQVRSQDFGVAQGKAQAEDAINRFNAQNASDAQARNVASRNSAQQYNLGNNQRISDSNVNMDNAEQMRQADARRQFWNDQLNYANSKANAYNGQANTLLKSGQASADSYQKLGTGVAGAIGAGYDYSLKKQKLDQDGEQN